MLSASAGLTPILVWASVLVVSLAALVKGADWFTGAAERIGLAFGMPRFLVGVTIVAVGTSLPELASSVLAVLRGAPAFVSGNVVGSNVANLLLILALAGVIGGRLRVKYELLRVDLPFLAGSAFFLVLIMADGGIGQIEASLSLGALAIYLWYALSGQPVPADDLDEGYGAARAEPRWLRSAGILLASAGLVYLGADYTVEAVITIADLLAIGTEVIAATAVAFGTSLPEVAVTVAAARRRQPELAVGNVLGSNVFNSFAVIGVSGLFGRLVVPESILELALPVMVIATLLTFFMIMEKELTRWEGSLLLLFYVYFVAAVLGLT